MLRSDLDIILKSWEPYLMKYGSEMKQNIMITLWLRQQKSSTSVYEELLK